MSELTRITVSLEADLLKSFDGYCKKGRFATRSEAVRQLLRQTLTQESWDADTAEVTATLSLVYDHHRAGLTDKLIKIQHKYPERVVASTHVHLDHDRCLEVIISARPGQYSRALRRRPARPQGHPPRQPCFGGGCDAKRSRTWTSPSAQARPMIALDQ